MADRIPENLALLYGAFSKEAIDRILPGDSFTVDGVEFVCKYSPESTPTKFHIVKPIDLVNRYRALCAQEWRHAGIVELGIAEGGSTALLALLARPEHLVAVDIEPEPLDALDRFITDRGLQDSVRPFYGLDQGDHEQLAAVVDGAFAGASVDLVIDDASHQYELTRSSFETLFPRLRPGGMYVVEDWNAAHAMRIAVRRALQNKEAPDYEQRRASFREARQEAGRTGRRDGLEAPLSRLAVELLLACAGLSDAVESVSVDRHWLTVIRGAGELDRDSFRLADVYWDFFGNLPPLVGS
ncbi:MAG: hypothetical protein KatS3mg009_2748 [Acidimicrobiia bacterium]|nr:MAG: hypothetical protein KatS3mg009_2748 [Acidimicrobiia bacterium]